MKSLPQLGWVGAVGLAGLMYGGTAGAEGWQSGLEVTPFIGGRLGGGFDSGAKEDRTRIRVDDDASLGLVINWPATAPTEWEVVLSHQSTSLDRLGTDEARRVDLDITYAHVGGLYLFEGAIARPYMAATLGATHFNPDEAGLRSETRFSFALGLGYKLFPASRVGLRLDARAWGTVFDSNSALFCQFDGETSACLVRARGSLLWQWELSAGAVLRF
ncbi:MAG: hypothetical protein JJT85_00260 [Chromatiales bacterium]|nr:hypothetical protein [Chromatiales bacterium]